MFSVGDIVVGIGSEYSCTGMGSVNRVTVVSDRYIEVEVLEGKPDSCSPESRFTVEARQFRLAPEYAERYAEVRPKMKIESLKVFNCQKEMRDGSECGELAEERITIPGLSVTLCGPHAAPYLKGGVQLEPIKCVSCLKLCKPGYHKSRDYGYPFCNERCETNWLSRESRRTYAGRT